MRKIYFVTLPNGYFGSSVRSWNSLSISRISRKLAEEGYEVLTCSIDSILDCELNKNDFLVYTSSDEASIRNYIKDTMYFANQRATLVPSYEVLLAHENKGFQELFRCQNNFGNLRGRYHYDADELPGLFPYVFKSVSGSGSVGVRLVQDTSAKKKIRKDFYKLCFKRKAINYIRSKQLSATEYSIYQYRHKGHSLYVTQEFVPNLTCDYRVLVFSNKYYVMRRDVRKNDFRASGSKKFNHNDSPSAVLDFAREVYRHIDSPYVSLDIALDTAGTCSLIEYQGMNFGTSALRKSVKYHEYDEQKTCWVSVKSKSDLENEYSNAIYQHIIEKIASKA